MPASSTHLSFHGYTFGEVARLVDVAAAQHGAVVGKELQGHDGQQRGQDFVGARDLDPVVNQRLQSGAAFRGHGDDVPFAGANLLDVGHYLVIRGVLRDESQGGEVGVDQGDGPVLHLAGCVPLGVDVSDLLEL